MFCSNCGAKINDGVRFCPQCGIGIPITQNTNGKNNGMDNSPENSETGQWVEPDLGEYYDNRFSNPPPQPIRQKKIKDNPVFQKISFFWQQLAFIEKCICGGMLLSLLLFFGAILSGRIVAIVCAVLQLVAFVFSFLVYRKVIKLSKPWIGTVSIVFAVILLVPYLGSFSANKNITKIDWNEIQMGEVVPKPPMKKAEVLTNSEDMVSLLFRASSEDYNEYISICEADGFVIDVAALSKSYSAFNENGYRIFTEYDSNENELRISLYAPLKMSGIQFPTKGLASKLPAPDSTKGQIIENTKERFSCYLGEMSNNAFSAYVEQCKNAGFAFDGTQNEKKYTAKNEEGYTITVEYLGFNVVGVSVDIPIFDVSLTVTCVRNMLFSRYDVEVYIDDKYIGTVDHGSFENYELHLGMGSHALKFESSEYSSTNGGVQMSITDDTPINIKVFCYSSGIDAEIIYNKEESDEPELTSNLEEKTTDSAQTNSSEQENTIESTTAIEETSINSMPVMKGVKLSDVCSAATALGVSEQPFSDEDRGDGTKMRTLWNSKHTLSIDICYSAETLEILYGSIVTFPVASFEEQKSFVCGMAPYLCPSEDSDTIYEWVNVNIGSEKEVTINNFTYELSLGVNGSVLYNAGVRTWEEWLPDE